MNLAHKGRRKWCPLNKIRFLHFAFELHSTNSNFSLRLSPHATCLITFTLGLAPMPFVIVIFYWDFLPTLYIIEPWALILYHVIRAILLEETLRDCIHYFQYNTTVFGVKHDGVLLLTCVVNSWLVMLLFISSYHYFFHACFKLC